MLCRWQPGWMTPWAPWPLSWSTVLRLSLNSKENVWCHCSAALSTRVLSWRTASTGGEWKLFLTFTLSLINISADDETFVSESIIEFVFWWLYFPPICRGVVPFSQRKKMLEKARAKNKKPKSSAGISSIPNITVGTQVRHCYIIWHIEAKLVFCSP